MTVEIVWVDEAVEDVGQALGQTLVLQLSREVRVRAKSDDERPGNSWSQFPGVCPNR